MPEPTGILVLSPFEVALAALLVTVAGAVSFVHHLGMGRTLLWASVRTVVQLTAVGYLLEAIFRLERLWAVLPILLLMTVLAARAAVGRVSRRFRGIHWTAFSAIFIAAASVLLYAVVVVVPVRPWWHPQYAIPLLGMVLGNSLNWISLGLDRYVTALAERRAEVEMLLSHGATRDEAVRSLRAEAVRTGMIPMVNAMMVVGTVSLPGMMTGQILSGTPPRVAVAYQIVIMFLLAAAATIGTALSVLWSTRLLFDRRDRLRTDRFERRPLRRTRG